MEQAIKQSKGNNKMYIPFQKIWNGKQENKQTSKQARKKQTPRCTFSTNLERPELENQAAQRWNLEEVPENLNFEI